MASFRRTLSPANLDRSPTPTYLNGSTAINSSLESRRFFAGISPAKPSRRNPWRKPLYRCLLFFIFGFILGILPFGHVDDSPPHDFSFNRQQMQAQHENLRSNDVVLAAEKHDEEFEQNPRKLLIVVTPTYNRVMQAYYLNRLGQVLRLVNPPLLWIVVEMKAMSLETAAVLRKSGVMYRHLVCDKNSSEVKDRGVHQRNTALNHIEIHRLDGIVYFADDDNVYSLELFERIRDISRFGTWPVAMLAQGKNKAILEGPVCSGSRVIGWHTNEKSKRLRRFHVDMSGFAFNSTILWDPKRFKHPFLNPVRQLDTVKEGFQETTFMEQVVAEESQMEGIPDGCGKILNWHLHLDARGVEYPRGWVLQKNLDAVLSID